ncbi:MAG: hypothetical protein QW797_00420 [Thermoproteota archaeon]
METFLKPFPVGGKLKIRVASRTLRLGNMASEAYSDNLLSKTSRMMRLVEKRFSGASEIPSYSWEEEC